MNRQELNELSKKAYKWSKDHGFWTDTTSVNHAMAMIVTEIAEVIEADRYGRNAKVKSFKNSVYGLDPKGNQDMWNEAFKAYIKDTVQDEMADIIIRIMDLGGRMNIQWEKVGATTNYIRIFRSFDMPENAYTLIAGFCNTRHAIVRRMVWAVDYVQMWFDALPDNDGEDLKWFIEQKMTFNASRPKRNGKKY